MLKENRFCCYNSNPPSGSGGGGGSMTDAEIKTAYERNSNTNAFDDSEQTKLAGIESSAKDDQTGAEIKTAYEGESNTNALTDALKTKLEGIEDSATSDQTGAEIKTAYEAEANTNAFTDALKTKLDNAEDNATADQTGAEIKAAYESQSDTNAFTDAEKTKLGTVESNSTADQTDSEIESAYNNQVSQVSSSERTAGTESSVRRFSPSDVKSMIDTHATGGGGGSSLKDTKDSVRMATTANITLSGVQTIDGVSGAADDRVVVWFQTDKTENGIYLMKSGAWVRTDDADDDADVTTGLTVYIEEGTKYGQEYLYIKTTGDITVGTDNIEFAIVADYCPYLAPIISKLSTGKIAPSQTGVDIVIEGHNFPNNIGTSAIAWTANSGTNTITTNSVTWDSPEKITINIDSGTNESTYDLKITTTCGSVTMSDAIEVKTSTWKDLRTNGESFTDGNQAGRDIRYRSGMSLSRDANGMSFLGAAPWNSWVKFEILGFTRGDNKTIEWIMTNPSSSMMIGIGSDQTNETSGSQFYQQEVGAYFPNGTTFSGLYGNTGTPGAGTTVSSSIGISSNSTFKLKFTSDGGQGGLFELYELPSAADSDWDDETSLVQSMTISAPLNPQQNNIFPFIIPPSGGAQRFIAVRVVNTE